MTSALLALSASVSWGVADYLGGIYSRRLHPMAVLLVVDVAGFLPVLPFALAHEHESLTWKVVLLTAAGGVCGGLGLLAFYRGMRVGAIPIVAPITGLSPIIPIAVGLATGDNPSVWQELGFVLALGGSVLVAREQHPETGKVRAAAGVGFALIAMACFGCYFVVIHAASQDNAFWALVAFRAAAAAFATSVVLVLRPSVRMAIGALAVLVCAALFDLAGSIGYTVASRHGELSIVAVLAALYPLTMVVLATVVGREHVARVQLAGAGVALAGVALVVGG